MQEEREARDKCQTEAAQAKAQLAAADAERKQLASQLEQANALIVALQRRELQDGGESPTYAEGVPPVQRRVPQAAQPNISISGDASGPQAAQPQQGAAPMAAHFASPGLRYV